MRLCSSVIAIACLIAVSPLRAQDQKAVPSDSAHAALLAAMKNDLRQLVSAQAAYLARHGSYASVLSAADFKTAAGHEVKITTVGNKGYSATVTAAQEPALTCGLFEGAGQAPNAAIFKAREPACWRSLPNGALTAE